MGCRVTLQIEVDSACFLFLFPHYIFQIREPARGNKGKHNLTRPVHWGNGRGAGRGREIGCAWPLRASRYTNVYKSKPLHSFTLVGMGWKRRSRLDIKKSVEDGDGLFCFLPQQYTIWYLHRWLYGSEQHPIGLSHVEMERRIIGRPDKKGRNKLFTRARAGFRLSRANICEHKSAGKRRDKRGPSSTSTLLPFSRPRR